MNEGVNNELSNLFQELVVSKIRIHLEDLERQMTEIIQANGELDNDIAKLPKTSGIKRIVEENKEEILGDSEKKAKELKKSYDCMEIFLREIATYLQKQYSFPNDVTLSDYLSITSDKVANQINSIAVSQSLMADKLQAIDEIMVPYKNDIISVIKNAYALPLSELKELLDQMNQKTSQSNESIAKIIALNEDSESKLDNSIEILSHAAKERGEIISKLADLVNIANRLTSLEAVISSSDIDDSIKKLCMDIGEKNQEISKEQNLIHEILARQEEQINETNKKIDIRTKMLIALTFFSIFANIVLIILGLL